MRILSRELDSFLIHRSTHDLWDFRIGQLAAEGSIRKLTHHPVARGDLHTTGPRDFWRSGRSGEFFILRAGAYLQFRGSIRDITGQPLSDWTELELIQCRRHECKPSIFHPWIHVGFRSGSWTGELLLLDSADGRSLEVCSRVPPRTSRRASWDT